MISPTAPVERQIVEVFASPISVLFSRVMSSMDLRTYRILHAEVMPHPFSTVTCRPW
jgi:hypothetical protein